MIDRGSHQQSVDHAFLTAAVSCKLPSSAYISWVFNFVNFVNLESFVKFIEI